MIKINFSKLPEDMQILIADITCNYELSGDLTIFKKKLSDFPILEVEKNQGDNRLVKDYLEPMQQGVLPPVVILGEWWYDGVHRVAAARTLKMTEIDTIDLAEIGIDENSIESEFAIAKLRS